MTSVYVPPEFLHELKEKIIMRLYLGDDELSEEEAEVEIEVENIQKDIQEVAKCMKTTSRKEKSPRIRTIQKIKKKDDKLQKSEIIDSFQDQTEIKVTPFTINEEMVKSSSFDVISSVRDKRSFTFSNSKENNGDKFGNSPHISKSDVDLVKTSSSLKLEKKDKANKKARKERSNSVIVQKKHEETKISRKTKKMVHVRSADDFSKKSGKRKSNPKKNKDRSTEYSDLSAMVANLSFDDISINSGSSRDVKSNDQIRVRKRPSSDTRQATSENFDKKGRSIEIIKKIGKGGSGTVWKGLMDGRSVAIKQIDLNKLPPKKSAELRKKIRKEVDMIKSLNNKYVLKYIGLYYNRQMKEINVVMEIVEGVSISDLVEATTKFTEPMTSFLIKQILKGLNYLHDHNIIHRDIKPDNILIDKNNNVKIIDFGTIAINASGFKRRSTVGTPWYCAPEVIKTEEYNFTADIWSLGCMIIEMVSGKPPFDDQNSIQCLYKMSESIPPIPQDISEECHDFIKLCLNPDKNKRPTALELLSHPFILKHKKANVKKELHLLVEEILESKQDSEES